MIIQHLSSHGFSSFEAVAIAKLCTNWGVLPQGAPTSPVISNSVLFDLDATMQAFCAVRNMQYTRYADDITVSGNVHSQVVSALENIRTMLGTRGFNLNEEKTRIASAFGQQRVTGVVVNVRAAPSRSFRRRVRAAFHHVTLNPEQHIRRLAELTGFVGYLKMFPELRDGKDIASYQAILADLKRIATAS